MPARRKSSVDHTRKKAAQAGGSGATILVVDDEPQNVDLMKAVLENAGYSTLAASNGAAALEILGRTRPSAVLLDVMMPGMNGHEVLRRIRQTPAIADIPVLVITATYMNTADRERLGREAQGVLQKGAFRIEELLKEIARIIAAGPSPGGAAESAET